MSYDKNECNFTGKVDRFEIIATKTGTPMIKFFLACGKERLAVVAFKSLADATRLIDGDPVSITGAIQTTCWETNAGEKRYGIQIIATRINDNEQEPFTPAVKQAPAAAPARSAAPLNQPDLPF